MGQGGALTLLFIFINPLLALAATISVISLYDCKSQPKHKGSGIRTTTHSDLRVVCMHSEKFEIICLALCITYPLSYEWQNKILINLEFYKWLLFIESLHKLRQIISFFSVCALNVSNWTTLRIRNLFLWTIDVCTAPVLSVFLESHGPNRPLFARWYSVLSRRSSLVVCNVVVKSGTWH